MIRGFDPTLRPALLISECQRGVIDGDRSPFGPLCTQVAERRIVPRTAALAAAFRKAGLPVVHLHIGYSADYGDLPMTSAIMAMARKSGRLTMGSPDTRPVDALMPEAGDIVHQRGFSLVAFHNTDLDARLRYRGVRSLVLAGISTDVAISGLATCGSDLGYHCVVAEDCIAGSSAAGHEVIVKSLLPLYATVTTSPRLMEALAAFPAAPQTGTGKQ
jgi:nicotinamidase-related amidase